MLPRQPSHYCAASEDRLLSALFPPVQPYARLDMHNRILAIGAADLMGAVLLACAIFLAYATPLSYGANQLWVSIGCFVPAWFLVAKSQNLYDRSTLLAGRVNWTRPVMACAMSFGLVLFGSFALKVSGDLSRVWFLAWVAATVAWTLGVRLAMQHWIGWSLRGGASLERAMVLAGTLKAAHEVGRELEEQSAGRIRAAAVAAIPGVPGSPPATWVEQPLRNGLIDRVFVADFDECSAETNALVVRLAQLAVDVTLVLDTQAVWAPVRRVGTVGLLPAVDVAVRPLSPAQATIKRAEDIVVAAAAVLIVLPVLALIAILIKLDSPGPVLFRQVRTGFHDQTFRVWKFRTMYHHLHDSTAKEQTRRGDPRVTRVGRWLRRTSLDELPQLFNVLRGEMSLVGPRPHALKMTAAGLPLSTVEDYAARAPHPARHHRLGAGQRLPWRSGQRGESCASGSGSIATTSTTGRSCSMPGSSCAPSA